MELDSRQVGAPSPRELLAEVLGAGGCVHPIRVAGTVVNCATGEQRASKLLVACKDRRASLCPPCAALYQADAWILVSAGLVGGKGVEAGVARHPKIFLTLTAPSFGAVHRASANGCHRSRGRCDHGAPRSCRRSHGPEDPLLGTPLCPSCFDYRGAVLWNAQVTRLWNRSVQELLRQIGIVAGVARGDVEASVRLSYLKVAEFQRRGLVHLHVIVRADGRGDRTEPPPAWLDASVLARGARSTLRRVSWLGADERRVAWGAQFDVAVLGASEEDPNRVASYVAKYATKTTGDSTALARRFHSLSEVRRATLTDHERTLVETAWRLGRRPEFEHLHLARHAHSFGYRGQLLTKSRHFSHLRGPASRASGLHGRRWRRGPAGLHLLLRRPRLRPCPSRAAGAGLGRHGRRAASRSPSTAPRRAGPTVRVCWGVALMEPITLAELERLRAELDHYRRIEPRRRRRLPQRQAAPFEQVATELELRSKTRSGRATLELLSSYDFAHTELGCLRAVAERLDVGPAGERRGFELDGLLRLTTADPNVVLMVIVALRPALERIVVLVRARRDDDEVVPELLGELCEQLSSGPRPVPELLQGLQVSLRRLVRQRAAAAERQVEVDEEVVLVDRSSGPGDVVDDLLETVVARGVITQGEAQLIVRSTVCGESLQDLAQELHLPYRTLQSRRLRALANLRTYLEVHEAQWLR